MYKMFVKEAHNYNNFISLSYIKTTILFIIYMYPLALTSGHMIRNT